MRISAGVFQDDEIVLKEEARLECNGLPIQGELPDLLGFFESYPCEDVNRLIAGQLQRIDKHRGLHFADFVRSGAIWRRLPIVLVSPRNNTLDYLVDVQQLASRLRGTAHVMRLNNRTRWNLGELPLNHPCYDGAIRVYLADYRNTDARGMHPVWRPRDIEERGAAITSDEVVRLIEEKSLGLSWFDDGLDSLERQYRSEEREQELASRIEELRGTVQADLETSFLTEAVLRAENYLRLKEDLEASEQIRREQANTIRALKYQLKQRDEKRDNEPLQEPGVALYLSEQAHHVYEDLDEGIREEIDQHLLNKMLDSVLCDRQTRAIPARNGTCFVYPTGGSPQGRRVIYKHDDHTVSILELFLHHDSYEEARNRGFDLADYSAFRPWAPAM